MLQRHSVRSRRRLTSLCNVRPTRMHNTLFEKFRPTTHGLTPVQFHRWGGEQCFPRDGDALRGTDFVSRCWHRDPTAYRGRRGARRVLLVAAGRARRTSNVPESTRRLERLFSDAIPPYDASGCPRAPSAPAPSPNGQPRILAGRKRCPACGSNAADRRLGDPADHAPASAVQLALGTPPAPVSPWESAVTLYHRHLYHSVSANANASGII